jgi:hypothetical protein
VRRGRSLGCVQIDASLPEQRINPAPQMASHSGCACARDGQLAGRLTTGRSAAQRTDMGLAPCNIDSQGENRDPCGAMAASRARRLRCDLHAKAAALLIRAHDH